MADRTQQTCLAVLDDAVKEMGGVLALEVRQWIARMLPGAKIAGPWRQGHRYAACGVVAMVRPAYLARMGDERHRSDVWTAGPDDPKFHWSATRENAASGRAWCDAWLRRQGWLLMEGPADG